MSKFYDTDLTVKFLKAQLKTKKVDKKKIKFLYLEVELAGDYGLVQNYNDNYANTLWDIVITTITDNATRMEQPRLNSFTSIDFGKQNVYPLSLNIMDNKFDNVRINLFKAKYKDNKVWLTVGFEVSKPGNNLLLQVFGEETVITVSKKQIELFSKEGQNGDQINLSL